MSDPTSTLCPMSHSDIPLPSAETPCLNIHLGPTTVITTKDPTHGDSHIPSPSPATTENPSLNIHRGAIDQTTVITTKDPKQVMERMGTLLHKMGMHVTQKGGFLYRCSLRKEESSPIDEGPPTDDRADVVRFTVELTLLDGLKDTYSLDIRRLRGPLRRYKQIYDDIRDVVQTPQMHLPTPNRSPPHLVDPQNPNLPQINPELEPNDFISPL